MTFAGHSHSAAARAKVSAARVPAVLTARVSLAGSWGRTCQSEGARKLTADTTQLPLSGRRGAGLRCGLGGMPWRPALCRVRRSHLLVVRGEWRRVLKDGPDEPVRR